MGKRVVILIDGSNLYLSSKRLGRKIWPPDLPEILIPKIDGDLEPVYKTHYFTSVDRKNAGQARALNQMAHSGIIIYDFDLKNYPDENLCPYCNNVCPECGRILQKKPHKEKMVDIALATKAIELAYQNEPYPYDTFVIVSGDKDLIPAIRLLRQDLGKEVIVAGFRNEDPEFNSLAYEIDKEVDKVINLCDIT